MTPSRGRLLVKRVETQETFAGGKIVIPDASREKLAAQQFEVALVGAPAFCDDEDCERPHDEEHCHPTLVCPGDWILASPRSAVESDDPQAYLIAHDAVVAVLTP